MSWISGSCQDNRHYSCYYAAWDDFNTQWCRDSETPCPGFDDGGGLIGIKDNRAPSGGGW